MQHSFIKFIALTLMLATSLAIAQTIAEKVDYQGQARYVRITGLSEREKNGLLSITMELSNSAYDDQQAFYRVAWLDETRSPVWDDEPWKPVLLHGNQKQMVQIVAPTIKARDFKIQFNAEKNWSNSNTSNRNN